MMKKISLLAVCLVVVAQLACKKNRTCHCTMTKTGTSTTHGSADEVLFGFPVTLADTSFSTPINDIQVYDRTINKSTKSAAKNNCISYSEPYKETTLTSVPASSFNLSVEVTNEGTVTYDCKLK
jgi:hypothetical protein